MLTNGVISVVLIFVVLGCTNFSDRRHRFVEAKDDRLAGSPYVQELVEKVQGQWDPPGARQKDKIFAGTIVDVSFSIEAMDGAIAAIKPIPARNQLGAEIMCRSAVERAGPFGKIPNDIMPETKGPLEITLSFHY